MPEDAGPAAVALELVRRINAHDLDGIAEMLADDHQLTDYAGATLSGRDAVRAGWSAYFRAFPAYRIHVESVHSSGNSAALTGRVTGSHLGPAESGGTFVWVAEVRGGLLSAWRVYADTPLPPDA